MVESLQTTTHSRPSIAADAGDQTRHREWHRHTCHWRRAATAPGKATPGSIKFMTRSRGNSLPRATWRSRARSEPPKAASARRVCNSATSARMRSALARNSAAFLSIDDERIAKAPSPTATEGCLDGTRNAMAALSLQIRNIRNRPALQNVFCHEVSTSSGNSEGIQRRHPVRKAKLLSTVAAALLLGAGAASAQGMSKEARPNARPQRSKARRPKRSRLR